jgi:hypothetical protein
MEELLGWGLPAGALEHVVDAQRRRPLGGPAAGKRRDRPTRAGEEPGENQTRTRDGSIA